MFFNKKDNNVDLPFIKIASLLIHVAKIDEDYSKDEEEIIIKTLITLGAESSKINEIMKVAIKNEENSNQILEFTKEVKSLPENDKVEILEALWTIIYSNNEADIYETNLMRRLAGLLYIDSKIMGNIKEKIKKKKISK
tara:strand:+ start:1110 stop:1526 length:417 start_codon:yes stop_codon:yes gene_type:complete